MSEAQPSGAPCWLRAHREQQREACSCGRKLERAGELGEESFYRSGWSPARVEAREEGCRRHLGKIPVLPQCPIYA